VSAESPLLAAARGPGLAVTAELGPPRDPDPEPLRRAARALSGLVDAVNVTDNQAATVKCSALASSAFLLAEGVAPILQMTTRDRNVLALQGDLLGAHALGVRAVLALSGDPLSVGPYGELTRAVSDFDSLGLIALIAAMNKGRLYAGEELTTPTAFTVAAAANPLVDTVDKLVQKLDAGAELLQTNIVFDVERFAAWFAGVVAAGVADRAPVLVGVTPPRGTAMLERLDRIPGVEVDAATFSALAGLEGAEARAAGIAVAARVIEELRGVPGVGGVHLMAPGWEEEAVPALVASARLGGPGASREGGPGALAAAAGPVDYSGGEALRAAGGP